MKMSLLVILLSFAWTFTSAQTIAYRHDEEDAIIVATNYTKTNSFKPPVVGVALIISTPKHAGEIKCAISLYSEGKKTLSQENSRAVFKTFSGNIITIRQTDTIEETLQNRKNLGSPTSFSYWALRADYDISEKDLNSLMNEGIALLRIETLGGIREFNYDKDVLGRLLRSEFDLINNNNKSFENDF